MPRNSFTTACARVLTSPAASVAAADCARTPNVTCAISGAYVTLPLAETEMHGGGPLVPLLAASDWFGATVASASSAAHAGIIRFMARPSFFIAHAPSKSWRSVDSSQFAFDVPRARRRAHRFEEGDARHRHVDRCFELGRKKHRQSTRAADSHMGLQFVVVEMETEWDEGRADCICRRVECRRLIAADPEHAGSFFGGECADMGEAEGERGSPYDGVKCGGDCGVTFVVDVAEERQSDVPVFRRHPTGANVVSFEGCDRQGDVGSSRIVQGNAGEESLTHTFFGQAVLACSADVYHRPADHEGRHYSGLCRPTIKVGTTYGGVSRPVNAGGFISR